jgi:hypothetical protein
MSKIAHVCALEQGSKALSLCHAASRVCLLYMVATDCTCALSGLQKRRRSESLPTIARFVSAVVSASVGCERVVDGSPRASSADRLDRGVSR